MEASFCSLAPVEDAVRGLVNGIESVEELRNSLFSD